MEVRKEICDVGDTNGISVPVNYDCRRRMFGHQVIYYRFNTIIQPIEGLNSVNGLIVDIWRSPRS